LEDDGIRDIADVLTADKDLYAEGEEPESNMIESPPRKEKLPRSLQEDADSADKRSSKFDISQ
jgi:hypothetical protein